MKLKSSNVILSIPSAILIHYMIGSHEVHQSGNLQGQVTHHIELITPNAHQNATLLTIYCGKLFDQSGGIPFPLKEIHDVTPNNSGAIKITVWIT